jgi:hypothetical protein
VAEGVQRLLRFSAAGVGPGSASARTGSPGLACPGWLRYRRLGLAGSAVPVILGGGLLTARDLLLTGCPVPAEAIAASNPCNTRIVGVYAVLEMRGRAVAVAGPPDGTFDAAGVFAPRTAEA